MKTCLYKPIFINPQAYYVFPQLYNIEPKNTDLIEYAQYSGQLIVTDITNDNTYSTYNRSNSIDLSKYNKKCIRISQYTDTGAVVLGEWNLDIGNESGDTDVKPIASYRCYDKTNDDTDRDVLKDLTGNGHDIQLYNFAFAESSGYGEYGFDLSKLEVVDAPVYDDSLVSLENNTIKFYGIFSEKSRCGVRLDNISIGTKKFKFKCINIPEGKVVDVQIINGVDTVTNITFKNGINTFDFDFTANDVRYFIIYYHEGVSGTSIDITIEQIPDYQGALVSDGVDDYGLCENFPILTKEKGYTVCAIRKWISTNNKTECFLSKRTASSYVDGSFIVESKDAINRWLVSSFGAFSNISDVINLNSLFISQKSNNYNLSKPLSIGDNIDNNKLIVFSTIGGNFDYSNVALYALEIYDRDLTDEEIAKVKARMIAEYEEKTGEKYPIEYPGLIAAWSAEGKTNSDPDRNILKDLTGNGHDITLNNFAFNSDNSGYEHPDYPDALVFDGVDDYGINENMPILTDYTVIIKRTFISKRTTYTISKTRGNFGAFGLESPEPLTMSFGSGSTNIKINFDGISWQTKNSYNQQPINSGNNVDSNFICLGSVRSDFGTCFHGVIYSAYLFDRSLDEQEIKLFIRKYIDSDYVLPSEQQS